MSDIKARTWVLLILLGAAFFLCHMLSERVAGLERRMTQMEQRQSTEGE